MTAKRKAGVAALILSVLLLAVAPATAQVIWGTSTATYPNDPGFEGMWKYCLDIEWDTSGHALSHTTLYIDLEACPLFCDPGFFMFPEPAGSGPGEEGCTVVYYGSFLCFGDPTSPGDEGPTIKFEYDEEIGCEPGPTGSATLCFYSVGFPTEPDIFLDYLGIKFATSTATGDLEGVLPSCITSPVRNSSWGTVKALYR